MTAPAPELDRLSAEVESLRAAVDALTAAAAAPRVVLEAVDPPRYLGQTLSLVARVSGPDRRPLADVPLTLIATWGRLRGSDGFSVAEGANITLRTAGDGTVRVTLAPPTSEDLQATQQAAVETALGRLDPAAATPRDAADALAALVREYRFDANDVFRAGVDIYVRDFHGHLFDRVNFRDELKEWATFDSAVVAYAQHLAADGSLETRVQSAAALVVQFRDWLGPWLQTHLATAEADTLLGGEFALATNLTDPSEMLSRIHQRVVEFAGVPQGVVGQLIGQKVAESKLSSFLETGIDALPQGKQQALFPAVGVTAATVANLGVPAVGAIERATIDVRSAVDTQVATSIGAAVDKLPAIEQLKSEIAGKVDQTALDAELATKLEPLNTALAAKVDQTTLNAMLAATGKVDQAALAAALASKVDQTALDTALATKVDQSALTSALASKVDQAALDATLASKLDPLNAALATKVDQTALASALATKVDQTALTAALATKVDQTALTAALATKVDQAAFTKALATKVDHAAFTKALAAKVDQTALTAALATKVDQTALTAALATKVDQTALDAALASKVDQTALDAAFASKLEPLNAALAGKVDQAALDTALASKVDQTALDAALASKVDQTALDAAFASKLEPLNAALATKVDQTALDTALATKVDQATLTSALAAKVDQTAFTAALASKVDTALLTSDLRAATSFTDFQARIIRLPLPIIQPIPFIPPR